VFLSGGVDSTSIAALAARHKNPLQTFSSASWRRASTNRPGRGWPPDRLGTEHVSQKFSGQDAWI